MKICIFQCINSKPSYGGNLRYDSTSILYTLLSFFLIFTLFLKYQVKLDVSSKFSKYPWLKSQLQDFAKNNKIMT